MSFRGEVIHEIERRIAAIPEDELRLRDDETPADVADRFVATRRARSDWDESVGPFLDSAGLIRWAGYGSRQNLSNAVERGDVLAVPAGRRQLYPTFQFSRSAQPLPSLRDVVGVLRGQMESPWTIALWLNTPVPAFSGRTPAQQLRRGDVDAVVRLARSDAARLAS